MSIAVIGEFPGGNAQADQEMMRQIGASPENPPAGGIARMAGPLGGSYQIISVWESEEAWEAFRRDRMEPAFQQMGRPMPDLQIWKLDTLFFAQR